MFRLFQLRRSCDTECVFTNVVLQLIQEDIDNLKSQLQAMSESIGEDDQDYLDLMPIKQRVSALGQRCVSLGNKNNGHLKKLESLVEDLTTFSVSTEELRVFLNDVFDRLEAQEPIHNEAETINKQLHELQVNQNK